MNPSNPSQMSQRFVSREAFAKLFDVLRDEGYTVIGPTIEQDAIVYDRMSSIEDLPRGWTDEQAAGHYRLRQVDDEKLFGYVVGPQSWKRIFFPPQVTLSEAVATEKGWEFFARSPAESEPGDPGEKFALLGVRACELAAIRVQDRVFLSGPYVDPLYRHRRNNALIIAVNCTGAASTCFCTSLGTGPRCTSGYDLGLTELDQGFVIEVVSNEGAEVVAALDNRAATIDELRAAQSARQQAVDQIERALDTTGLRDLLLANLSHPRWDEVARRCMSCANCTLVCPTCFCSSVEEVSDLTGERVERRRTWDSCFNVNFSYMNGGNVRDTIGARYRQWLTHKLASWIDQFGTSGCVGCGRCITWCPVGIDLTEEVAAIRGDAP
jgi:ferredoxin